MTTNHEHLIGKKAYKNHSGMFGGLIGTIERSDSGISPLCLRFSDGSRLGAFPKDLVIIDDEEAE